MKNSINLFRDSSQNKMISEHLFKENVKKKTLAMFQTRDNSKFEFGYIIKT